MFCLLSGGGGFLAKMGMEIVGVCVFVTTRRMKMKMMMMSSTTVTSLKNGNDLMTMMRYCQCLLPACLPACLPCISAEATGDTVTLGLCCWHFLFIFSLFNSFESDVNCFSSFPSVCPFVCHLIFPSFRGFDYGWGIDYTLPRC